MKDEYILCSAIWFKEIGEYKHQPINISIGYVVTGLRHSNCLYTNYILSGKKDINSVEGFLTNKNRFVNRTEAAIIAYNANQIDEKVRELFSEDLY